MPAQDIAKFIEGLSDGATSVLLTRGVLKFSIPTPPTPKFDSFEWLKGDPEEFPENAFWFIDGSAYDARRSITCRLGFAIVVVSQEGDLLGLARGTPPQFIRDSAGAEVWAFATVIQWNPSVPITYTDCLNILKVIDGGRIAAVGAASPLARTWRIIFSALDDDQSILACRDRLVWLPAHRSTSAIGTLLKSDGTPLTAIQWRGNRLVDWLAKSAAEPHRLGKPTRVAIATAEKVVDSCRRRPSCVGVGRAGAAR